MSCTKEMSRLSFLWSSVLLSCSVTGVFAEVIDDDIHGLSPYFPDHKPYFNSSSFRNTSLNYHINTNPSNQDSKQIKDEDVVAKLRFHIVLTNDTLHNPAMKEEHKEEHNEKHDEKSYYTVSTTSESPYYPPPVWALATKLPVKVEEHHSSAVHYKKEPPYHELYEGLSEQYYGQKVEEKKEERTTPTSTRALLYYTTPHPGTKSSSTAYPTTYQTTTYPTSSAHTTTTTQVYKTGANKVVVDLIKTEDDKEEAMVYGKARKQESEKKVAIKQEYQKPEGPRLGTLKAKFEIHDHHDMPLDEYDDWIMERPVIVKIVPGSSGEVERMDNVITTTAPEHSRQQPARRAPEQPSSIGPEVDLRDVLARIRFHIFRINEILQVVPEQVGSTGSNPEPPARIVTEVGSPASANQEGPSASSYYEPPKDAPYVKQKTQQYVPTSTLAVYQPPQYIPTTTLRPPVYQAQQYAPPKPYAPPVVLGDNDNVPSYSVPVQQSQFRPPMSNR
ncbi:hypothetical protein RvY_09433-2 [Ramazzottius varieornatus]|uniref:Uncharacterized protein n=1 Tax=Ramazzottius varieornatus TaxID=947166 RepID=A0A1D1VDW9_RAMVA|nr:hypothetical protein RvY_09433-2 [Ramazzottius varieornatus]